jgi:site-specific recombinase XerD
MGRKKYEESANYLFEQKFSKPFEEFITVQNATEALSSGTKGNYRKDLPEFFLWLDENPDQVIASRKIHIKADDETSDHYERKVKAYKKYLEDKNQTGRCIAGKIGRIQGFFKNNSSRFKLNLGIMKYNKERKVDKYSPDNKMCQELYSFCDSARDRLIVALACQNGLTPKDIAKIKWHKIPAESFKYYEASRSKNGVVRHGVTTPEIIQEFAAYKKIRGAIVEGEPLFKGREGFLDSKGISQVIDTLIKKAGYDNIAGLMPKSLRDSFEDALVDAEIPGKVKEAMMGHSGDIEHQYGGQKRLEARLEECMQKAYKFLILTEVVNTNGKSAQKISDLDNAVVESQKKIAALETINSSLTDRLAKTEKILDWVKQYSASASKKELWVMEKKLEVWQKKLQNGTAKNPEYLSMAVEVLKVDIAEMKELIKKLDTAG